MYLNLSKRYLNGDEIGVWNDIHSVVDITPKSENWGDIIFVLNETMLRVKFNFDLIYTELKRQNYSFCDKLEYLYSTPDSNINELKSQVHEFGFLPLSIEYFYKYIFKINLLFQHNQIYNYKYSDPVYIESVNNILNSMEDGSWKEIMFENIDDNKPIYIEIAPDFYHKDNTSGGIPYGIELTKKQQIDSKILNTPYGDLFFVKYLRLSFEYGGFPNIAKYNNNYTIIVNSLKKGLKVI